MCPGLTVLIDYSTIYGLVSAGFAESLHVGFSDTLSGEEELNTSPSLRRGEKWVKR